jgi:hypothetical protein
MGIFYLSQYFDFTEFLTIMPDFYVSLLTLKSIFIFILIQSKKEKEEHKWFNYESKGEH